MTTLLAVLLLNVVLTSGFHLPTWSTTATGPRVSGHAAATDSDGRVLAFGGLTDGAGSPCTDEMWAYDGTWTQLKTSIGPGKLMYAASAVLNGAFYLFGGWDPEAPGTGGSFKDESWKLDLASMQWTKLDALPCGPVSRHTAVTVGDKIIVQNFRSTVVCDGSSVSEQPTTGESPVGFSMCAASALGEHEMLIFGGATKSQGMTSDAFVLDTRTWEWRKLRPTGSEAPTTAPTPRGSACATAIDASTCVVFGGAGLGGGGYAGGAGLTPFDETWQLRVDGDAAEWTPLELGSAPEARVAASLNKLPSGELLLHGGWTPTTKETFAESHVLKL